MSLNIITNGQTREIVTFDELTPRHQVMVGEDTDDTYVVYKDWPYAIGDFMKFESDTWDVITRTIIEDKYNVQ